jgi:hypothetical protein
MAAMIRSMDDSLSELLDKLAALNLATNMVFLFLSDNSGVHWPNRARGLEEMLPPTSNLPLRAGKCCCAITDSLARSHQIGKHHGGHESQIGGVAGGNRSIAAEAESELEREEIRCGRGQSRWAMKHIETLAAFIPN